MCELAPNHASKSRDFGTLLLEDLRQGKVMVQLRSTNLSSKDSFWSGLLVDASLVASCIAGSIALVVWIG